MANPSRITHTTAAPPKIPAYPAVVMITPEIAIPTTFPSWIGIIQSIITNGIENNLIEKSFYLIRFADGHIY